MTIAKHECLPARWGPTSDRRMTACLLCTGPLGDEAFPYSTLWQGEVYRYLACRACGSSTLNPLPTADALAAMYARDEYHSEFYDDIDTEVSETQLSKAIPYLRTGRLLDFGCGNGSFLRIAGAAGFTPTGIELDPQAQIVAAQQSGHPVRSFDDVAGSGDKFAVIHLGDVLEHLPCPAQTMRLLEALLEDDGCFFIEGPLEANASLVRSAGTWFGATKRLAGLSRLGTFPPYHLFQTNMRAQKAFFTDRLGYRLLAFETYETGWPYRTSIRPRSAGSWVKHFIGSASILASGLNSLAGLALGNRFYAVLRPGASKSAS